MTSLVDRFFQFGFVDSLDRHLALSLQRISGEEDPTVLLGAALASRAPRYGHICVDIPNISSRLVSEDAREEPPWPDPSAWLKALHCSPLVRRRSDTETTPLVIDRDRLYLDRYWNYQVRLSRQLQNRSRDTVPVEKPTFLLERLNHLFGPNPADELNRQRLAALVAAVRRLSLITGGPGTGKTTTVAAILSLLIDLHTQSSPDRPLRIALAAPTAKAADRVAESIVEGVENLTLEPNAEEILKSLQSLTIHKLLGWQPRTPTRFRHNVDNPLPHDVVVIDEASMVDLALMSKLVDAVRPDARLILLGDPDQLASVEAGAVLGDLCTGLNLDQPLLSQTFLSELEDLGDLSLTPYCAVHKEPGIWDAIVQLNKTWRFGLDTGIGRLSSAVRKGDVSTALSTLEAKPSDLHLFAPPTNNQLFEEPIPPTLLETILGTLAPAIRSALEGDALTALKKLKTLRVLAAHRQGPLGLYAINEVLARGLCRIIPGLSPSTGPWLGQPIMVRQNDAHLRLRNGQVGVLIRGDAGSSGLVAAFLDGEGCIRKIGVRRLPRFETMLCMTIHQSQGSQFDHAVLILPNRSSPILTRELLYTGITRARKHVSILGTKEILTEAIKGQVQRASGLKDELWHTPST